MKRLLSLTFLLATAPTAFAASSPTCVDGHNYSVYPTAPAASDPSGKGTAVELLAADLRQYVVSFCHPFYAYSYRKLADFPPGTDAGPVIDSKNVQNMYAEWNRRYVTPNDPQTVGENVDGLYFAVDPIVSREFGRLQWILYRAELPENTTALNVAYMEYESDKLRFIPAFIQAKMKAEGCSEYKYDYLFRKNRSKACRQIAVATLNALNVDAVQYSWRSADFTSCRGRQRFAYIVVRPEIIKSSVIFSYQGIDSRLSEENRVLLALYRTAQKNQSPFTLDWSIEGDETVSQVLSNPDLQLWPNSSSLTPLSDSETADWVHAHFLGCQP